LIFIFQLELTRKVYHIQFTSWPDFGVLTSAKPILETIEFIEERQPEIAAQHRAEEKAVASSLSVGEPSIEASGEYEGLSSSYENSIPEQEDEKYSPIVIHCSAGVGRTGTFCCISNSVERLEKSGHVDIFSTVKSIREQRAFSVQTPEQYQFCYSGILEYVRRKRAQNGEDATDIEVGLNNFLRRESSSDSE